MPTATNRGNTPDKSEMKACDTQAPLSKDDPRIIAWNAYKATGDYKNTRNWALHDAHVDGSLWAAFIAGWSASSRPPADPVPDMVEAIQRRLCAWRCGEVCETPCFDAFCDAWRDKPCDVNCAQIAESIAALQAVPAASGEVGECSHPFENEGPRIPLRYGTAATMVCRDCGAWRQSRVVPAEWHPAEELAQAFRDEDTAIPALKASGEE